MRLKFLRCVKLARSESKNITKKSSNTNARTAAYLVGDLGDLGPGDLGARVGRGGGGCFLEAVAISPILALIKF